MIVKITKILNRTDLAISAAHGGLVVTKNAQAFLRGFFQIAGVDYNFLDEADDEFFPIHYKDYTSNGTTPNDRITPIGKYATKHELKPGDILMLQKNDIDGTEEYVIDYARKQDSVYFVGKSKERVEVLELDRFEEIRDASMRAGTITQVAPNRYEMGVRYMGEDGTLIISRNGNSFELYFNERHIEENQKYFELDTTTNPFELKKTETWEIEYDMGEENSEINDEADQGLIRDLANMESDVDTDTYIPMPEEKRGGQRIGGRTAPNRNRGTSQNALARARYLCEYDNLHELFPRKHSHVNYTEPHHLIPLEYDELFEHSLDVQANIVSLCSHCHNRIHYSADAEVVIRKLWEDRCEEIADAGIGVMNDGTIMSIDILLGFYGIR